MHSSLALYEVDSDYFSEQSFSLEKTFRDLDTMYQEEKKKINKREKKKRPRLSRFWM